MLATCFNIDVSHRYNIEWKIKKVHCYEVEFGWLINKDIKPDSDDHK